MNGLIGLIAGLMIGFLSGAIFRYRDQLKISEEIKELGQEIISHYEDGEKRGGDFVFRGSKIKLSDTEDGYREAPSIISLKDLNGEEKIYIKDCVKKSTAKKIIFTNNKAN